MDIESTYVGTNDRTNAHIIDVLIEERAENLSQHPLTWRLVRTVGDGILGYERAVQIANKIAPLRGRESLDHLSKLLKLEVEATGQEFIPRTGPAIMTPNHPAGIADGIAVYDVLKTIREDVVFVANRDALRISPGLKDIIIPVEWRDQYRTPARNRETITALVRAIKANRFVVIFPSGRLAQPSIKGLIERPWQITAVNLASKYNIPLIPMHIKGRNTMFYYSTWFINNELKDMTLFREFIHKRGQRYSLTIGEALACSGNVNKQTEELREFVLNDLKKGTTKYSERSNAC